MAANFQMDIDNIAGETEKLLQFLNKINGSIQIDAHRDDDRMLATFYQRQINHLKSLLLLKNHCDIQLIARSMFEALIYLSYSLIDRDAMARWSFYGEKIDNEHFEELNDEERRKILNMSDQERVDNGIPRSIGQFSNRFKDLFFKEGVFNTAEYGYSWLGRSHSIYRLTIKCDEHYKQDFFRRMYQSYYSILSSYHHWDIRGIGNRYKLNENETNFIRLPDNDEILYYRFLSFCLGLTSISSMIDLIVKYRINLQEYKDEWENLKKVLAKLQGAVVSEKNLQIKD